MAKPMAKGMNHLPIKVRQAGGAAAGRIARCASHGTINSEKTKRPTNMTPTHENSSGQRVDSTNTLLMSVWCEKADQRQEQKE